MSLILMDLHRYGGKNIHNTILGTGQDNKKIVGHMAPRDRFPHTYFCLWVMLFFAKPNYTILWKYTHYFLQFGSQSNDMRGDITW